MRRYLPFVIIGSVLLITAGGGWLLFRAKQASTPLQITTGTPGAEPPHVRGVPNARLTLEEFGDFQCPPCGIFAETLLKAEHDHATSIRVVFRQFPLTTVHKHAFDAACAAEAAGLQGHFWEMHDLLFQNAKTWSKESPRPMTNGSPSPSPQQSADETAAEVRALFAGYAETLGLDVERFKKDVDSEQVKARIKADQDRAASIKIVQTPTLFMNGTQVPFSSMSADEFPRLIEAELSGKGPTPAPPSPTPEPEK